MLWHPFRSMTDPSPKTRSGLPKQMGPSPTSTTISRSERQIWGAANPTPSAAYMVSTMSCNSFVTLLVTFGTGFAFCRNMGSPLSLICRTANAFSSLSLFKLTSRNQTIAVRRRLYCTIISLRLQERNCAHVNSHSYSRLTIRHSLKTGFSTLAYRVPIALDQQMPPILPFQLFQRSSGWTNQLLRRVQHRQAPLGGLFRRRCNFLLVFSPHKYASQLRIWRVMGLLPITKFLLCKSHIIVRRGRLDGVMTGSIGLEKYTTGGFTSARSTGHLCKQLNCPLRRAKIGNG